MPSRILPGLGLTAYWDLGSSGWKPDMDTNIRLLSALVQCRVISRDTALPGSPSDGDMYIVPDGAGEHPNEIAIRDNGEWVYITPLEGFMVYVVEDEILVQFDGTDWIEFESGGGGGLEDAPSDSTYYTRRNGVWVDGNNFFAADSVVTALTATVSAKPDNLAELPDVDVTGAADGDVLMYDDGDNTWKPGVVSGGGGSTTITLNDQSSNYTLVINDAGKLIRTTGNSSADVTVPPNASVAFAIGTIIYVTMSGIEQTVIVPGSGVTINSPGGATKIRARYSLVRLIKVDTNTWNLTGDLAPVILQKTGNHTLVESDAGAHIQMDVATSNTLTVPTNSTVEFPIGTSISIRQIGLGKTAIVASGGVTITTPETLYLRKQHSTAALIKTNTNTWELTGDLELA